MNEQERLFTIMAELASALATTTVVKAISDATGVPLQPTSLIDQHQISTAEYYAYKEATQKLAETSAQDDNHQTVCEGYEPLRKS